MPRFPRALGAFTYIGLLCFMVFTGCSNDGGSTTPEPDPPVLSAVEPDTLVAGTTVRLRGERFGAQRGSSQILIGGQGGQSLTWADRKILAIVPDDVTAGQVSIVVDGRESNRLSYSTANKPPVIAGLLPDSGEIGGTIRIQGRLFGAIRSDGKVLFNALETSTTAWSDTLIEATIPVGAQSGEVRVVARGLGSDPAAFTLVNPPVPLIEWVEPDSAEPGVGVAIHGRRFGSGEPPSTVRIGGATAVISSWSDTLVEVSVPQDAVPGNQTILVLAGQTPSNAYPFRVLQPAVPVIITRLEPSRTTVSDIITIYGTGFRAGTLDPIVTFQGAEGRIETTITVWDEESIRAWVPQGAVDGPVVVQFGDAVSEGVFFSVAPQRYTFTTHIHPLFENKGCLGCHSGVAPNANLNLETKALALRGNSDHGPVVQIRNGPGSILVRKLGPNPPFGGRMPFGCSSGCLTNAEILMVSDWIDEGVDN
jgi:hypothetical protein